jgi:hypothetical protein
MGLLGWVLQDSDAWRTEGTRIKETNDADRPKTREEGTREEIPTINSYESRETAWKQRFTLLL